MKLYDLLTNHVKEPMGFEYGDKVIFSYKADDPKGKKLVRARIQVSTDPEMEEIVWDSGDVPDPDTLSTAAAFERQPRTRYFWRVIAESDSGETASASSFFETGKEKEAWRAKWISSVKPGHAVLKKDFTLRGRVKRARVYMSGLGIAELRINGQKATDEVMIPFLNEYDHWIQVVTLDITPFLCIKNEMEIALGDGWALGRFAFGFKDHTYGALQTAIAECHIEYEDGTEDVFGTDTDWCARKSRVTFDGIYDGEKYDATMDVSESYPVRINYEHGYDKLMGRLSMLVRVVERFAPQKLFRSVRNELILDMGQEITGWLEMRVRAEKGRVIRLRYFEIMQDGAYYHDNLRTAKEEYEYTSDGTTCTVAPHFTFYGFRYVMIEGYDEAELEDFTACVVHSDLQATGRVVTSHEKLNRFILNARWGQRGNFLDVPTDCPQRDERMGWTGDAQVFSTTACYNYDCAGFYTKYLYDMKKQQESRDGAVHEVVPSCKYETRTSCAWSDAATIMPWVLYTMYGDRELLARQYPNMKMWVEWIRREDEKNGGKRLWLTGHQYADWLALDAKDPDSCYGGTDKYYVASAYYWYSTKLLAKAATVLGYREDAEYYGKLRDEICQAIRNEFFTPGGRISPQTQTSLVCALYMGFAPEEVRGKLAAALEQEIADRNGKLCTGFVGTAYLLKTLSQAGNSARAYDLMLNEEYPGWLYEVNMGATSVWERWNSVNSDGHLSSTGMNSLNHYSYGSALEWIYRYAAGIAPVEDCPGFKKAVLAPCVSDRLKFVDAEYDSAMGKYESKWSFEGKTLTWRVRIPFGATATLVFPKGHVHDAYGLAIREENGVLTCEADSGEYVFVID